MRNYICILLSIIFLSACGWKKEANIKKNDTISLSDLSKVKKDNIWIYEKGVEYLKQNNEEPEKYSAFFTKNDTIFNESVYELHLIRKSKTTQTKLERKLHQNLFNYVVYISEATKNVLPESSLEISKPLQNEENYYPDIYLFEYDDILVNRKYSYDKSLLIPLETIPSNMTTYQKCLVLGMLNSDMFFASFWKDSISSMKYYQQIDNYVTDLGWKDCFEYKTFGDLLAKRDYWEIFMKFDFYMMCIDDESLVNYNLAIAGGIIEELVFLLKYNKLDSGLLEQLALRKNAIDYLSDFFKVTSIVSSSLNPGNNLLNLSKDFNELRKLYDIINLEYVPDESKKSMEDGSLVIYQDVKIKYNITPEKLKAIENKVLQMRADFINKKS